MSQGSSGPSDGEGDDSGVTGSVASTSASASSQSCSDDGGQGTESEARRASPPTPTSTSTSRNGSPVREVIGQGASNSQSSEDGDDRSSLESNSQPPGDDDSILLFNSQSSDIYSPPSEHLSDNSMPTFSPPSRRNADVDNDDDNGLSDRYVEHPCWNVFDRSFEQYSQ